MAKIVSIHMLAPRKGVTDDDFEQFVKEEWYPNFVPPKGAVGYLLKGMKGDRQGRYAWIWEFESIELAERIESEDLWRRPAGNEAVMAKWGAVEKGFGVIFTDYVVIE
jgi:hypothetical protein